MTKTEKYIQTSIQLLNKIISEMTISSCKFEIYIIIIIKFKYFLKILINEELNIFKGKKNKKGL